MALSPEAQEAAATVYVKKGDSLEKIEVDHPELVVGVRRLRDAAKKEAKSRRGQGSGPGAPVSSRPKKFS